MFVTLGRDSPPFGVKTLITHVGWFFWGRGFTISIDFDAFE